MFNKVRLLIMILAGGFFLFLDQLFKYLIQTHSDFTFYIWQPWLGVELFFNKGIAFSLPFPNWLLILLTPILLLVLMVWAGQEKRNQIFWLGIILVLSGAISNFIDRIIIDATVDYLRILTGVINLADVVIVGGAILLVVNLKNPKANS